MTDPYTFPRKYRSCLNCVHFGKPAVKFSGVVMGGCRERMEKLGVRDFGKQYCGQWYLKQIDEREMFG